MATRTKLTYTKAFGAVRALDAEYAPGRNLAPTRFPPASLPFKSNDAHRSGVVAVAWIINLGAIGDYAKNVPIRHEIYVIACL